MSASDTPSRTKSAYAFIEAHCNEYDAKIMCKVLGVARAGYYARLNTQYPIGHWKLRGNSS